MKDSSIVKIRRTLIRIGKLLPFILCFVLFIAYLENLIALINHDYMEYDGCMTLYTPITFWLTINVVKYDVVMIIVTTIISFAIRACIWNKLAILYLIIQLVERHYISQIELYEEQVLIIAIINLVVSGLFTFKGLRLLFKNKL